MAIDIPWAVPTVGKEELAQVTASFEADWLTMGPKVREFESRMAKLLGAKHALAVGNGTVALDMLFRTLGIAPGDEVIVPAMTYIATSASVSFQHAVPVFVDIDPVTWNLDPARIAEAISDKTKAIVFIDYGGNPADYDAIAAIGKERDIHVVQDGAQSLGAKDEGGNPVGAQAAYATMSFHMAKVMTTVEGGMVFTSDDAAYEELRARRNQGEKPGEKYIHSFLGTNGRMMDMQAGIGLAQLDKVQWMLAERRRVAARYDDKFAKAAHVECARARTGCHHAYFFYPVLVDKRDDVASQLRADHGIDTRVAYPMPVYEQPVYRDGREASRHLPCPVAERVTGRVLNLPIFPQMTDAQVDKVADAVIALSS